PELVGLVHRELRTALARVREGARGAGPDDHASRGAPPHVAELAHVAGLAQLAGWVAADAGAPVSTLATYKIGLRAADRSGDRPPAGHRVGCLAQLTAEDGDAPAALRLARAARRRAGATASAATSALLSLRLSYAAALAGQRRTCEEAITMAERAYE